MQSEYLFLPQNSIIAITFPIIDHFSNLSLQIFGGFHKSFHNPPKFFSKHACGDCALFEFKAEHGNHTSLIWNIFCKVRCCLVTMVSSKICYLITTECLKMLFSFFIVVISLFLCIKSLNHEFIKGNIRHKHDQSMAIYIAILCLVPISEVLRHIVVLVSHCGGKFGTKYRWCHIGGTKLFWNILYWFCWSIWKSLYTKTL